MVTTELATIWITSDGKKFLNKKKAEEHEKIYQRHEEELQKLKDLWEDNNVRIKQFP